MLRHVASLTWLQCLLMRRGGGGGWASLSPALSYSLQSSGEGIGLPARCRLVPSCSSGLWHFTRRCMTPRLGYLRRCSLLGYLYKYNRFLHRVYGFYQGRITIRWTHGDAYACIPGQVTILDSDGTGPRTQVYVVRCAWAPMAMPYPIR
jgi:hypothetical protein